MINDLLIGKSKEHIIRDLSKLSQKELNDKLLSTCLYGGLTSAIQYLIDAGADVNYKDYRGCTPLIIASTYGHIGIVNILINNGAKVNIKNMYSWTALMWASLNGRKDIVELLKKHGAKE